MKHQKGRYVKIFSGKDRGKTGTVSHVDPEENRIIVDGLNVFKKHSRPKRQGEKGQMVLVPRPLPASQGDARLLQLQEPDARRLPHGWPAKGPVLQKVQSNPL